MLKLSTYSNSQPGMKRPALILPLMVGLALIFALSCTPSAAPSPDANHGGIDASSSSILPEQGPRNLDRTGKALALSEDDARSAVIAMQYRKSNGLSATNFPGLVRELIERKREGRLPAGIAFPLPAKEEQSFAALSMMSWQTVVKWGDAISEGAAPLHFGSNSDYIAFFGDGWNADWTSASIGSAPWFRGGSESGWMWVNHEACSNLPALIAAMNRSGDVKAQVGTDIGEWSESDKNALSMEYRRQVGGSWLRVERDDAGVWQVVRSAKNLRYDGTSNTRFFVSGHRLAQLDHDFMGTPLPPGVVAGTSNNCSGVVSPWGSVIVGEENTQEVWGDLEYCWDEGGHGDFTPRKGFAPGALIAPELSGSGEGAFGIHSDPNRQHNRDTSGYLTEFDPGVDPMRAYTSVEREGASHAAVGVGHRKIGVMGRARWENATFASGDDFQMIVGKPIVLYGSNDRYGGRIYKFVSNEVWREDMTRAEARALLDDGRLFVAHFADLDNQSGYLLQDGSVAQDPSIGKAGRGQWIELSVENSYQAAPNATALGHAGLSVGDALQDLQWNGIGGFADDDALRRTLFTAATKIGVRELNRPEDIEYNAHAKLADGTQVGLLHLALTKHTKRTALDAQGVLWGWDAKSKRFDREGVEVTRRADAVGAIFNVMEDDAENPHASKGFQFWPVWKGAWSASDLHAAACPDNMLVDMDGGLWFATDGNEGVNNVAEGVFYLDLTPGHRDPTSKLGLAWRIASAPKGAECTGPALTPDGSTFFISVQHPEVKGWPQRALR